MINLYDINIGIKVKDDDKGCYIVKIDQNSKCYTSGLLPNDIIIKVNGYEITNSEQLIYIINTLDGNDIFLEVMRGDKIVDILINNDINVHNIAINNYIMNIKDNIDIKDNISKIDELIGHGYNVTIKNL